MSGFIPMVSTTPPPIEDDDFTEFVDSTQQDDFGDFSSPTKYEEYSYPSLNSPPDITTSMSFPSEGEESPTKERTKREQIKGNNDKEVKDINEKVNDLERIDTCDTSALRSVNKDEKFHDQHTRNHNGFAENANVPPASSPTDNDAPDWLDFNDASTSQDLFKPEENHTDMRHNSAAFGVSNIQRSEEESKDSGIKINSEYAERFSDQTEGHKENIETESLDSTSSQDDDVGEKKATDTYGLTDTNDKTSGNQFVENSNGSQCTESTETKTTAEENNMNEEEGQESGDDETAVANPPSKVPDSDATNYDSVNEAKKNDRSESDRSNSDDDFAEFGSHETRMEPETLQFDADFDADFDDFQSVSTKGTSPEKLETDQFNAFDTVTTSKTTSSDNESRNETPNGGFECNFGAFESSTKNTDDFEEFADFSTVPSSGTDDKKMGSELANVTPNAPDDDFADFSSVPRTDSTWPSFSNTVIKTPSLNERVTGYISKYSKKKDDRSAEGESVGQLNEHLNTEVLSKDPSFHSPSNVESVEIVWSGELWDQLEDIDNTIALNFIWNGSRHNKHLLDSLGMHTQNILFSGAKQAYYVPTYYAAGLGLIDPNKGVLKPMSAAEKITAMSPTDKNTPAAMEELASDEPQAEWKTIADKRGSGKGMIVDGSWSRDDGIRGKLSFAKTTETDIETHNVSNDPVPIISPAMDLDYFDSLPHVGKGVKSPSNADLIDPELLELTSAPSIEPPQPPKDTGSVTLSKILASIKSTNVSQPPSSAATNTSQDDSKWEEEESKLSAEARSVLQRLPDLSYMRAKVLMFPMNMSRVNISDDI